MKALEDVTVLACEQYEAGTTATEPLAFMGATVIMVEQPGTGQPGRASKSKEGVDDFYHICLTMNKKSITLNLRSSKGVEIFKEMAKKADIVHDNLGPGTMDRLGLGYEALKKANPKLIVSTIKGFGKGPYENYYCMDPVAQAIGNSYSMTGFPDKPPICPGVTLGDTGSGMFSLGAILAALHQRDISGEGQFVEVAMAECTMNYNRANYSLRQAEKDPLFQGAPIQRAGNTLPGVAPYNIYETMDSADKDNYIVVIAREQKQWAALLRVIGREDVISDPRFKDINTRWRWVEEIDKMIEVWTSQRNAFEAFHALAKAGVPASITLNSTQMMNDPHFIERGMVIELDHPRRGKYKTFGCVQRLSESKVEYQSGPLLGQHNSEIYARYMGYTQHDLTKLAAEGII